MCRCRHFGNVCAIVGVSLSETFIYRSRVQTDEDQALRLRNIVDKNIFLKKTFWVVIF